MQSLVSSMVIIIVIIPNIKDKTHHGICVILEMLQLSKLLTLASLDIILGECSGI